MTMRWLTIQRNGYKIIPKNIYGNENGLNQIRLFVTTITSLEQPKKNGYKLFKYQKYQFNKTKNSIDYNLIVPFKLFLGGELLSYELAYETYGKLNHDKSNVILLQTGLSANSHAKSTKYNLEKGWWEDFIGPGKSLDTNKFYIICTNVLGGCFGSTGPSSIKITHENHKSHLLKYNPTIVKDYHKIILNNGIVGELFNDSTTAYKYNLSPPINQDLENQTDVRYGSKFPLITIHDIVRVQFNLLDILGIKKLHAVVGSSMGGMQSILSGILYSNRINKIITISSCIKSHPYSVALRHVQRQILLRDPNYNNGDYYGSKQKFPLNGLQLARQIGTITYRSGPEWEKKFGRKRINENININNLSSDFLIEQYLEYQGNKFSLNFDANSLLYLSKAMDLFDIGYLSIKKSLNLIIEDNDENKIENNIDNININDKSNIEKYNLNYQFDPNKNSLLLGLNKLKNKPILIIGVNSDLLFPIHQQLEIYNLLKLLNNNQSSYIELNSNYGHDTFLIDIINIGLCVKGWLELS